MKYLKIFALALFMVISCQPGKKFAFDDIEYIESFGEDETYIPSRLGHVVDLGIEGIQGFKIYGPYLIISSFNDAGQISILEKDSPYRLLGSFFPKGNGPGELVYPVLPNTMQFFTDGGGSVYAEFINGKSRQIRFDITRSIEEGRTVTEELGKTGLLAFDAINIGEYGVFYREMAPEKDAFTRYIIKDEERIVTKSMERLNSARIRNKEDDGSRFNVLYGRIVFDKATKTFAEVPGEINAVHLYSLDDSFAKTICFGKTMYDYNELADRDYGDRPRTTIWTQQYDEALMILYVDKTVEKYYTDETWRPSLITVYWDGSYISKANLPERVNQFDFDLDSFHLWAFDSDTETMYVYDVSNI